MQSPENALVVREAEISDITQMHEIRLRVKQNVLSNPALVTHKDYEEMLLQKGKGWVCESENRITGFAIADQSEKNIWALFVAPEHEGKGIGKMLHNKMMNWCLQHAHEWWLSTDPQTRAEEFYKNAGWRKEGKTANGEILFKYYNIKIVPAQNTDLEAIQDIAEKTWPVAYGEILSPQQLRYMLDKMYAIEALEKQLAAGHNFLLAKFGGKSIGFASFELNYKNSQSTKLHKLYVFPEMQGKSAGRSLLNNLKDAARKAGQKSILLNVNRHNKAVGFYKKLGFDIISEEDIDIGNGYFMNDYLMELKL